MKKYIITVLITVFISVIFLTLTIRGKIGSPKIEIYNSESWNKKGPFELSPERGRFALTYSLIEDKSFIFSIPVARFATPDLGYINGNYVSLFAPGVSFLIIPGYILGKFFGAAQIGTFAVIAFFAILNVILINFISIKLGARKVYSFLASFIFLFATPAFTYATTLYQHHISLFFILSGIYILFGTKNVLFDLIFWFLFAISLTVDYPNFFLMLPLVLCFIFRFFEIEETPQEYKIKIKYLHILSVLGVVVPLSLLIFFNKNSYGNPLRLSGTVANIKSIDSRGLPDINNNNAIENMAKVEEWEKTSGGGFLKFFNPRNLSNGLYVYFISVDRGIIFFTPIILFSIFGIVYLYRKNQKATALLSAVILTNLLVYSMWGDPWGGWSFGSRYLIPLYAISCIFMSFSLNTIFGKKLLRIIFYGILTYCILINLLGALTSSANPPEIEVKDLEAISGKREEYTYLRNWDYLIDEGSKSFVYNKFVSGYLTPVQYYFLISIMMFLIFGIIIFYDFFSESFTKLFRLISKNRVNGIF